MMKKRPLNLRTIGIVLLLLCSHPPANSRGAGETPRRYLDNTDVTACTEALIDEGENIIFSPAFQLAWNALRGLLGDDVLLQEPIPLADRLNRDSGEEYRFPGRNGFADAGFVGEGIVEKINRELRRKFGASAPTVDADSTDPTVIVIYAYLQTRLRFQPTFEILPDPIVFRTDEETATVRGFGIDAYSSKLKRHRQLSRQVEIMDFSSEKDFIVRLKPRDGGGDVLLARIEFEESLADVMAEVQRRIASSEPTNLHEGDRLHIPVLDFSIRHSFDELAGRFLANPGYEDYFFHRALLEIAFTIDETGAEVCSAADIQLLKGPPPRRLIFDGPFLLCLRDENAVPYLVVWTADPELMAGVNDANAAQANIAETGAPDL